MVGANIGKSGNTISAWEVGRATGRRLVGGALQTFGARIADFYGEERMSRATDEQIISLFVLRVIVTEDSRRHVILMVDEEEPPDGLA